MSSGTHELPVLATQPPLGFRVGKFSQKGTRAGKVNNEDSIDHFSSPFGDVLVVADGMGGHGHGDLASAIVVSSFRDTMLASASLGVQEALRYSLQIAHSRIQQAVEQNGFPRGVGSTVVVAVVSGNTVTVGHVGDSRCYLYRGGELHQITRDHSLVQTEIDAGRLTEEQALVDARASTLTRAVGATENVELELVAPFGLADGDGLLISSDGVHGYMDRTGILYGLKRNLNDPQRAAEALVSMAANTCNSDDDISVIFALYGTPDLGIPSPIFTKGRSEELQARRNAAAPVPVEAPANAGESEAGLTVSPSPDQTMKMAAVRPMPELPEPHPRERDTDEEEVDEEPRKRRLFGVPVWMVAAGLFLVGAVISGLVMVGYPPIAQALKQRFSPAKNTPPAVVTQPQQKEQPGANAAKTSEPAAKVPQSWPACPPAAPPKRVGIVTRGKTIEESMNGKTRELIEKIRKKLKASKSDPPARLELIELPDEPQAQGPAQPAVVLPVKEVPAESVGVDEGDVAREVKWEAEWKNLKLDVVILLPRELPVAAPKAPEAAGPKKDGTKKDAAKKDATKKDATKKDTRVPVVL